MKESTSHDSLAATVNSTVNNRYIRDSIYIRERGDTVYVNRWHTEWRDSIVLTRDTIRVTRIDSIPVVRVQEVIREVPSPVPRGQCLLSTRLVRFYRLLASFGALTIALFIFRVMYKLHK